MTKGPDPAGLWNGFSIKADADGQQWADFPTLGYSGDAVYIATKMFNVTDDTQSGTHLVGIPKSSLTAALPGITGFRKEEDINVAFDGTLQPAVDALGAANVYGYQYKAFSISPQNPGSIEILEIPDNWITGGPLSPGVFHALPGNLQLAAPPNAEYLPKQNLLPIDTGKLRLSSSVQLAYDGYWMVLATKDPSTGNAALQWFRIDANASDDPILETGGISDPAFNFFYPSMAVNAVGQVVIGGNAMFAPETEVAPILFGPSSFVVPGIFDPNTNTTTFGQLLLSGQGVGGPYERIASGEDGGHSPQPLG